MKKLIYILMSLILVAASASNGFANGSSDNLKAGSTTGSDSIKVAQSIIREMQGGNYKEGELLVKFKSGLAASSSVKIHKAVGASVIKRYEIVTELHHVKLPVGVTVQDAIQQYMSDPNVEYAEPNYMRCASAKPNDTNFGDQWALLNTGKYANGTRGADIKATKAWDISTGNSAVIVAILDSGIDYTHEDLVGNIWRNPGEINCSDTIDDDNNGFVNDCKGWNFVDDNNDPFDELGHGTHVAGIIGAVGNNGIGTAGVMWDVQLMPVKIFDSTTTLSGDCNSVFASDEIKGIQYAVNNGARVINASFHGEGFCLSELSAISSADVHQVLFVAAAGNESNNNDLAPAYPASYNLPNIISVAATDQDDRRVPFSNFGPNSVHVAAPGVYVLSTVPNNLFSDFSDKQFFAGTSMAAPHVSGLAGLLFGYYDGIHNTLFDHHQVRQTILNYVDRKPTLDGWIQTGGRINAFRSLSSLLAPTNLRVKSSSSSAIRLKWSDNATGETGYSIERSTDGTNFTVIRTLPANTKSFTDSAVTPGATYTYRVRAFNDISSSFLSNTVSASAVKKGPFPWWKKAGL
jgi:subtilisin family serine protease